MSAISKLQQSTDSPKHHDVTVIGAGWSGLVSCKCMLEEGLSVVALEKREDIGGVWLYSDDPSITTVMQSTRCTSSSTVTEMSDFPMSEEMGQFPHHTGILKYLHQYAEHFNLMPHIQLNTAVRCSEKRGNDWWVECENGNCYTSSHLIVATGLHQNRNEELRETIFSGFSGKIYHAGEIKSALKEHKGQRLLVMGGGETGSDICTEFYNHCKFIYWSIPRGQHFFRKYARVVPWSKPQALDKASSRMMKAIAPYTKGKPGLAWICKWTTNGSLLAYQGHGIPEWRNQTKFFHFFMNKNGKVLDLVDYERLVPKAGISGCKAQMVTFSDGTEQEFDFIIMSTGYKFKVPFLPECHANIDVKQLYKFVFSMDDPTLAFVGRVRPVVGSLVAISELQARWIARVYSKRVSLKSHQERQVELKKDVAFWNEYFEDSSQRIGGLVEGFTYVDDIAKLANVYPDYWALFKRNPKHWYVAYFAPINAATHRLNEPKHEEQAIATMQRHRQTTLSPVHLLLILFLRIIWFDWLLNNLAYLKYCIQVSNWWPKVREWRVTKTANWVWTLPKRVMFDNKS